MATPRHHLLLRLAAVLVSVLAATLPAQQPAPPPASASPKAQEPVETLKIATRLVGVSTVVLDGRNQPVRGLTRDDFILKQDGKEQPIRYFSADATLPLTLALMVDTSGSQKAFIEEETEASEKFFRVMLATKGDRAALVQFDTDVLQLQKLTTDERALENSLRYLSMPHPGGYADMRGGTLLYDAIIAAAQLELGKELGRRAIVILTDGDDHGSHYQLKDAIAAAQRADTVVYSVYYSAAQDRGSGQPFGGFGGNGMGALKALSEATGGQVFTVNAKTPLDLIFSQIADDMRLQYQIGYTPPESKPGEYHKIELKLKDGKHLTVQARRGYYAPK